MRTKKFWIDTAERVGITFAQALLAVIGMDQVNLLELDWPQTLGVAGGTAFLALLKAMAASKVGEPESASLVQ